MQDAWFDILGAIFFKVILEAAHKRQRIVAKIRNHLRNPYAARLGRRGNRANGIGIAVRWRIQRCLQTAFAISAYEFGGKLGRDDDDLFFWFCFFQLALFLVVFVLGFVW